MDSINEHLKLVSQWLDENVVSYPTPSSISLVEFDFNWDLMAGSFCLLIDDERLSDTFQLTLSQTGWMQFHPPMFFSPLGAPASFSAVNLTSATEDAINHALHQIFPRLKPIGLDKSSGATIWSTSPTANRINDLQEFERVRLIVSREGYLYRCQVCT